MFLTKNIKLQCFLFNFIIIIHFTETLSKHQLLFNCKQMENQFKQIRTVKSDELLTKTKTSHQDFKFSLSSKNQSSYKHSSNNNSNSNLNNIIQNNYQNKQKNYQPPTSKLLGLYQHTSSQYRGRNLLTQKKNTTEDDKQTSEHAIKQISSNIRMEEFLFKMKIKFVHFLQQIGCISEQILSIKEIENQNELLNKLIEVLHQIYRKQGKKFKGNGSNLDGMVEKEFLQKAKQQLKQAYELEQKIFERHRKLKNQHKISLEKNNQLQAQLNFEKEQSYRMVIVNKKNLQTIELFKKQLDQKDIAFEELKSTLQAKINKFRDLYEQQQNSKNQIKQRFENAQFELEQYLKMEQQYSNQIEIFKKEVLKWRDRCKWLEEENNNKQPKEMDELKKLKRQTTELREVNQKYQNEILELETKVQKLTLQNRHLEARLSQISFEYQRQIDQEKQNIEITILQWKQKLVDTIQQYQKLLKEKDQKLMQKFSQM